MRIRNAVGSRRIGMRLRLEGGEPGEEEVLLTTARDVRRRTQRPEPSGRANRICILLLFGANAERRLELAVLALLLLFAVSRV